MRLGGSVGELEGTGLCWGRGGHWRNPGGYWDILGGTKEVLGKYWWSCGGMLGHTGGVVVFRTRTRDPESALSPRRDHRERWGWELEAPGGNWEGLRGVKGDWGELGGSGMRLGWSVGELSSTVGRLGTLGRN